MLKRTYQQLYKTRQICLVSYSFTQIVYTLSEEGFVLRSNLDKMTLIEIDENDFSKLKSVSNIYDISISSVIHNIVNNNDVVYLSRPITLTDIIGDNTVKDKLFMWSQNLKNNLNIIDQSSDISDIKVYNNTSLCIANGPSFHNEIETGDLKKIANEFNGTILCCERNLVKCLENGIVPDYFVSIDGDPVMKTFIDDPIIDKYTDDMKAIFSITASNEVVERWKGESFFFCPYIDNPVNVKNSCTAVMQCMTETTALHTGGNCGSTLVFLSMYKKFNVIAMIGIDFAYRNDIDLNETQIWNIISNQSEEEILSNYYKKTNKFNNEVIIDTIFNTFLRTFMSWISSMATSIDFIQCGKYSALDEYPIKCMVLSEFYDCYERK